MNALFPDIAPAHLSARDLCARRGDKTLFEAVSLDISEGETVWVQGRNGIGKTTLLRLCAWLSHPDAGKVSYELRGRKATVQECVFFQGHKDAFKHNLTLEEEITFRINLYGSSIDTHSLLEYVGLNDRLSVPCGKLSAGQKRRLSLAGLILSGKPIWIMDEPEAALDQDGRLLVRKTLEHHTSRGGSVMLASHHPARTIGAVTKRLVLTTPEAEQ